MEVHHHPEIERKTFRQYLLEGLMIFLAVTMGFFAESLREHVSEKSRAYELAKSLIRDLKYDTTKLNQTIRLKKAVILTTDSLVKELNKSPGQQDLKRIQLWANAMYHNWVFLSYSGTYDQIKNSGSLRYFPDTVSGALTYYEQSIKQANKGESMFIDYINSNVKAFLHTNINYRYVSSVQSNTVFKGSVGFVTNAPFVEDHLFAYAFYCLGNHQSLLAEYQRLDKQAADTILLLQKQYDLESE